MISIELSTAEKPKPDVTKLGFGVHYTDHMFIMDYDAKEGGWHHPRIIPYQPIALDPAAKVFHYGQTIFEGMKAYKATDGRVLLFRPDKNFDRLNRSCVRMCIPQLDDKFVIEALTELVRIDSDWIPDEPGTSLYIRPFIIATEPLLGLASSTQYTFMIIMSPVGAYYAQGIKPVNIYVESEYVRAVRGGVGEAKTAANYAASLKAQVDAHAQGYTQVLWLDGVHRKYVEEVGSMNVFFKINGEMHTPALNGSILKGVTRDSVIGLLRHWGLKVVERAITIEELAEAARSGALEEAFGTGTAAVISPIGELSWHSDKYVINGGESGPITSKLYDTLTGIQTGALSDEFGWTLEVSKEPAKRN